jgi:hypothetical protein
MISFFLWYPLISFGLGLDEFHGFPLVSFAFLRFPFVSLETKENKIHGKEKPIKESLRRL